MRVDKWLWYARFSKSRSLASKLCESGKIRLNKRHIFKAHQILKVGDVLTLPFQDNIRIIRIVSLATRRGPFIEAKKLYEDLQPVMSVKSVTSDTDKSKFIFGVRTKGTGRPTKMERRATDRLRQEKR